jgi:hypothetical protein
LRERRIERGDHLVATGACADEAGRKIGEKLAGVRVGTFEEWIEERAHCGSWAREWDILGRRHDATRLPAGRLRSADGVARLTTYLMICGALPHFMDGMCGYVRVLPDLRAQ